MTATIIIIIFFTKSDVLVKPLVLFQKTQICIKAGKARPSARNNKIKQINLYSWIQFNDEHLPDKHNAPNSEMNNSKLGIATASKTKIKIHHIINDQTLNHKSIVTNMLSKRAQFL